MAAPVININTSGAFGLTLINAADATTNWAGFNDGAGGSPGVSLSTDIFIQNTGSVSAKISGTSQDKGIWYDSTTGIDMTVSGRHLYIWVLVTTVSLMNTIANGGMYVKVSDSAAGTNWNKYYVSGSDIYPGGWFRIVIDLTKPASEGTFTAPSLTSIRRFGIGLKSTGSSVADNLYVDRMDYGDGLQIEAGDSTTPASWQELFDADDTVANKYGIITKRGSIFYIKGGLTIGDPAGTVTTLWDDTSGGVVEFENPVYWNGALVSAIDSANLYKIEILGNGTGTTDVTWGTVVGTGDDRQGIFGGTIRSAEPRWEFDAESDVVDLDSVNLYGMLIRGAGLVRLSDATKEAAIGALFVNCGEVQPNTSEFLNCAIAAPVPDRGLEMVAGHNITNVVFVPGSTDDQPARWVWSVDTTVFPILFSDRTTTFNSAAAGDCVPFTVSEAVGDYFAVGHPSKFGILKIDVGTARVGGTLVWEYWSGAGWSTLSLITDTTNTLSTLGLNSAVFDPPTNWAATSLAGEEAVFYVRLRVTVVMTTNPIIDQGFIDDVTEHHLHIPVAGTYAADGFDFFGFAPDGSPKWMGENSGASAAVTINVSNSSGAITDAETHETNSGTTTVNNTVLVKVTVRDATTLVVIQNQRVLLEADAGGDLPAGDTVTITRSGVTASVSHTAHGMNNGQKIVIRGADQPEYNIIAAITNVSTNAYDYTISGTPDTPATGTITSTAVILDGLTDIDGIVQDTAFNFTSSQPTTGKTRKGTAAPFYKTAPILGTIAANIGLTTTAFAVQDE